MNDHGIEQIDDRKYKCTICEKEVRTYGGFKVHFVELHSQHLENGEVPWNETLYPENQGNKTVKHDEITIEYINSDYAPSGDWYTDVPVGDSIIDDEPITHMDFKEIDAICVTSRDFSEPTEFDTTPASVKMDVGISEHIADLSGEDVIVVESKTGPPNFTAVGQIMCLSEQLKQDWDGLKIRNQVIVSNGRDYIIENSCDSIGIDIMTLDD